jgi:hypothetical protein
LVTLAFIAIVIGALYVSSLPHVEDIPETFPFNRQAWMKYVPNGAEYVLYVNYDGARASGSSSVFGMEPLLHLHPYDFDIFPQDVTFEVDVQFQQGGTVTITRLHQDSRNALQVAFQKTVNASKSSYQGYDIFGLLMRKGGDQKLQQGFLSLADDYVIVSDDQTAGRQAVQRTLDQLVSSEPSLFDDANVRRGIYAAGISNEEYLGLYIGLFETQLNFSRMIVKSVVRDGAGILVTRSILFPSVDIALTQFGEAHRIYRDASSYRILDSWLVVAYRYQDASRLKIELTGI